MLTQGSTIAHVHHGVGTIVAIEEKEVLGSKAEFVTIHFARGSLEIVVGKKRLKDQVRELIGQDEAEGLFEHLAACEKDLSDNFKVRNRNNQDRLASGDPYELCGLVKGLYSLKKRKGSLSRSDTQQLDKALELLADELTLALHRDDVEEVLAELKTAASTGGAAWN